MDGPVNEGKKAEEKGEFSRAENLYRAATTALLGRDLAVAHFPLALLYDKMGQERNAFAEYRIAVRGDKYGSSSMQNDPIVLARYGDLAVRYGTREEAMKAYWEASKGLSYLSPKSPSPQTVPTNDSLAAVKSAAHTAAAMRHYGHGHWEKATGELDIALAADPHYWVAHFYRVRDLDGRGKNKEAIPEAALAEQLAPLADKDLVRAMRRDSQIPDLQGRYIDPKVRFPFEKA